jgi:membrane fusion protein (multidrug efflux system)
MLNPNEVNPVARVAATEAEAMAIRDDKVRRLTCNSLDVNTLDSDAADALESKGSPPQVRKPGSKCVTEPSHTRATKNSETPAKNSRLRLMMFALLPLALIAGGYFYVTGGAIISTDNAYVQADIVGVSTDVSGIVNEIAVRDNQPVSAGDILFKLDNFQFRLALERAAAQLRNTKNDLLALRTSYKDMEAQVEQARIDVDFNSVNFKRQEQLAVTSATPLATLDASRNTLQGSRQKLASLTQQLAGIAANLNGAPDAPIEEHPRYRDALAARDEAERQLSHTIVRAPFAGIVTNVPSLQPGQYLTTSTTAFYIVSNDHVWVQANPKEIELTHVAPGQSVTIEVDTYPGHQWAGTIESISPASASSFSLLPAQNTTGNWVKVVQRIPMRIRVENTPGKPALRVGMSVEVSIDTGHARGFPHFITDLLRS